MKQPKRPVKSRKKRAPEPKKQPRAVGKDLSVVGCVLSGLLLGVMVFALFTPDRGIPKVREVHRIKQQLEQDIEQLQAENDQLVRDIDAMRNDPFWQEKIAREDLNMALPGEIIYKFAE